MTICACTMHRLSAPGNTYSHIQPGSVAHHRYDQCVAYAAKTDAVLWVVSRSEDEVGPYHWADPKACACGRKRLKMLTSWVTVPGRGRTEVHSLERCTATGPLASEVLAQRPQQWVTALVLGEDKEEADHCNARFREDPTGED